MARPPEEFPDAQSEPSHRVAERPACFFLALISPSRSTKKYSACSPSSTSISPAGSRHSSVSSMQTLSSAAPWSAHIRRVAERLTRWKTLASAVSNRLDCKSFQDSDRLPPSPFRMNERVIWYAKALSTALERVLAFGILLGVIAFAYKSVFALMDRIGVAWRRSTN